MSDVREALSRFLSDARPIRAVPARHLALLALGLAAQIAWHGLRPPPEARADALPPPPTLEALRLSAAGDPLVMSKLLMLWLQAHDNQPGVSVPFIELDYARVEGWLERILALDPRAQYPLLAASRLYGTVPIRDRQRRMFEFVYRHFLEDPDQRWPWLAHAAIMAKHRLEDLPLALRYARAITEHATGPGVPAWARDMSAIVLEDMGELKAAQLLIGGLLESGRVSDPHEIAFLNRKLEELEEKTTRARGEESLSPTSRAETPGRD